MKINQINAMVAAGESESAEFKKSTGTRRKAFRTVCAMHNQRGGHVLFGVTPAGDVVGQQTSDKTIEDLSAEIRLIDPPVFPEIFRVPVRPGWDVIVVSSGQGPTRPYQYRGTSYRRVGNTTLPMSAEEYNRTLLERMHSQERWENQPASGWSAQDLDADEIRRTVDYAVSRGRLENTGSRDIPDLLLRLGLFRDGVLSRAAVVLFGAMPRIEYEMPQCTLRVARIRGTDRTEFLDNRRFHGNAFVLLKAAERFLRETLPIASRIEADSFSRIDQPLYPPLATREAILNALCHRDYLIGGGSVGVAVFDDRLEVTSPGELHFGLTPEKLFMQHESLPWNPLIADTFYRRGLIEVWGHGTLRMADLATDAGQPRPEIEDAGGGVTVRFRQAKPVPGVPVSVRLNQITPATSASSLRAAVDDLTDHQRVVLGLLDRAGQPLALREILPRLAPQGVTRRQVQRALAGLKNRRLALSRGRGPAARWIRGGRK